MKIEIETNGNSLTTFIKIDGEKQEDITDIILVIKRNYRAANKLEVLNISVFPDEDNLTSGLFSNLKKEIKQELEETEIEPRIM